MDCKPRPRRTPQDIAYNSVMKQRPYFISIREEKKRVNRMTNICAWAVAQDPQDVPSFDQRQMRTPIREDIFNRHGVSQRNLLGDLKAHGDAIKELVKLGLNKVPNENSFSIPNDFHNRRVFLEWIGARYLQPDLFDVQPVVVKVKHKSRPAERPINARKLKVQVDGREWSVKMEIWKVREAADKFVLDSVITCSEFRIEVTFDVNHGTLMTVFEDPIQRLIAVESLRSWKNSLVSDNRSFQRLTKQKADYLSQGKRPPHTRIASIAMRGKTKTKFLRHMAIVNPQLLTNEELVEWELFVAEINKDIDTWTALNGLDRGKFNIWLADIGFRRPERNHPGASIDPDDPN